MHPEFDDRGALHLDTCIHPILDHIKAALEEQIALQKRIFDTLELGKFFLQNAKVKDLLDVFCVLRTADLPNLSVCGEPSHDDLYKVRTVPTVCVAEREL